MQMTDNNNNNLWGRIVQYIYDETDKNNWKISNQSVLTYCAIIDATNEKNNLDSWNESWAEMGKGGEKKYEMKRQFSQWIEIHYAGFIINFQSVFYK